MIESELPTEKPDGQKSASAADQRAAETNAVAPRLRKPRLVIGSRLRFRNAGPDDAEFILGLRLDPEKNKHLSSTSPDLDAQVRWLEAYVRDDSQVYFIIQGLNGASVGTVRLYDPRGASFCWGSWILSADAPSSSAVESTLMVYSFGFACGFVGSHFDVRKGNEKVWQYHERFGAVRVGEDETNYYYEIGEREIQQAFERYQSRMPAGIKVEF